VLISRKPDEGKELIDPIPYLLRGGPLLLQAVRDVLVYGHMGKKGVILEHQTDTPLPRRKFRDSPVAKVDLPPVRGKNSGDELQCCGFAAAGWTEQADELTLAGMNIGFEGKIGKAPFEPLCFQFHFITPQ
jgi:hypothetical protein